MKKFLIGVILVMVMSSQVFAGVEEFRAILPEALDSGLTPSEVKEVIYQAVAYLGIGRVCPFLSAANEIFASLGISLPLPPASTTTPDDRIQKGNDAQVEIFGSGMMGSPESGNCRSRVTWLEAVKSCNANSKELRLCRQARPIG